MLAGIASALVPALLAALAQFPGGAPVASASGRYVVESVDPAPGAPARHAHALYVVERRSKARQLLLEYARNVLVAWAPDRDALAVSNDIGSTQTTLVLYVLGAGGVARKLDVAEALYAAFPSLRGELVSYLHVHLEVVHWRRGGAVECRLRASAGAGPDVTRRYVVTVDGLARRA